MDKLEFSVKGHKFLIAQGEDAFGKPTKEKRLWHWTGYYWELIISEIHNVSTEKEAVWLVAPMFSDRGLFEKLPR